MSIFQPINKTKLIIDKRLSNGGILSLHTDITELKNTQRIQEILLEAVNELPMIIDLWDEEEKVIFNNRFSKEFNKSNGVELKEGTSRLELLRQHEARDRSNESVRSLTDENLLLDSLEDWDNLHKSTWEYTNGSTKSLIRLSRNK